MSAKYTASLRAPFTSEWRKSNHQDLPAALLAAWRRHSRNWSVGSITKEQKVVMEGDELAQAIGLLDDLRRERPEQPARAAAEQVVRELAEVIE